MGSQGRRGQIILLNGTSSSGKSSIAGQLMLMLDPPTSTCPSTPSTACGRHRGPRSSATLSWQPSWPGPAARITDFLGSGQAPTAFGRLRSLLLDQRKSGLKQL